MCECVFIGPLKPNNGIADGVCVKNSFLVASLKKNFSSVQIYNTLYWKKNRFVILQIILRVLFDSRAKYVFSLNTDSAYFLFKFISILHLKRETFYFVAGGYFPQRLKSKDLEVRYYQSIKSIMVQGIELKGILENLGLSNVYYCPNFKDVSCVPLNKTKTSEVRFVFVSRITPEKGCDLIFLAMKKLNQIYEKSYSVHFYGMINKDYKKSFCQQLQEIPNAYYESFTDFSLPQNYEKIASYDVMLFPTYWDGEGFPGVVIDAYISGLPIIASDWNINKEIIIENETGWIIPVKDEFSLYKKMEQIIVGDVNLTKMKENCQKRATLYSVNNVLSSSFYKEIGLID